MRRALTLYAIGIKSIFHQLWHDLMREIVVAICALVVFSLFLYVFNDFLNVEISQVSSTMRDVFGRWLGGALLLLCSGLAGRKLLINSREQNSLQAFAQSLGENPRTVKILELLETATTLAIFYVPLLKLVGTFFIKMTPNDLAFVLLLMFLGSFLVRYFGSGMITDRAQQERGWADLLPAGKNSKRKTMKTWRLGQILRRNRLTQVCLLFSLLFTALIAVLGHKHGPLFAAILTSFMSGILLASAIAFQVADDIGYSWIEKSLGVSHDDYVATLRAVAFSLAWPVALINGCIWVLGDFRPFQDLSLYSDCAKVAIMTIIPVWIAPDLTFQIDARRPFIQITVITLLGLFLCTAVFSQWLAVLLIPIFSYYAAQTQNGHFYRA